MPVVNYAQYCEMLDRARKGSYMTLAENAMAARVVRAATELRSAGTTMMP